MKQLYAQALAKFPNDTRFWDEYIKFLQHFKFNTDISATFDRMLQVENNCHLHRNLPALINARSIYK